jgi:hypothetical protein
MSKTTLYYTTLTTLWGLTAYASLKIAELPGNWGHGLCGPWGCAPPIQSLVACHLAWLATLLFVTEILLGYKYKSLNSWLFYGTMASAGLLLTGLISYEYVMWYLKVSEYQKSYFLQRIGFSISTHIELPIIQLVMTSGWLLLRKGLFAQSMHVDEIQISEDTISTEEATA